MTPDDPNPCAGQCGAVLRLHPKHRANFEGRAWYCPACARALASRSDDMEGTT